MSVLPVRPSLLPSIPPIFQLLLLKHSTSGPSLNTHFPVSQFPLCQLMGLVHMTPRWAELHFSLELIVASSGTGEVMAQSQLYG